MKKKAIKVLLDNKTLVMVIFFIAIFSILDHRFLTGANLINILVQVAINGLMALGMTTLLVSGNFDLSVGSTLSITGMIAIMLNTRFGLVIPIIIAIVAGCFIGLINGIIVAYGKVNAFIVTLATSIILKGLSLLMNNDTPIPNKLESFKIIGLSSIGPIPMPVIYFIIFAIVFWFFMKYTSFGRNAYAIGGNEMAAKISGININFYKIMYFVLCGFCAAVAGVVLASRLNTGSPVFGDTTPLIVISAVILGGTILSGGKGFILGTIFGVLMLSIINIGMDLLNVRSFYQYLVRGSILVLVVLIDAYYERKKLQEEARVIG